MGEKEVFKRRLINSLDYAASVADVLWKNERALKELLTDKHVLKAMKEDAALFAVLMLKLPTGMFKPLPFQIDFLRDKSKRIVVCSGRQIGKTTMAAAKAIWFAVMHPNTTVLIVSKALRQSMWMFDKVRDMIFLNPILKKLVKFRHGTTRTKIEFKPPINSKIIALPPGSEGETIRGLTAHLLIIDEANFIKPEIITSVCVPMITATDGHLVMLSTPEYAEHPFMQAFNNAQQWGYTRYHFPSSIAPIPTKEAREKFLAEQQAQIPEDEYAREYLAILPDQADQLIKTSHIHACIEDYELISEDKLMEGKFTADYGGYDPGGRKDPAAFVAVKMKTKIMEDKNVPIGKVVFIREVLGEDYGAFSAFIKLAQLKLRLRKIAVDESGLGKPIVEDLLKMGLPIHPVNITKQAKLDLFRQLTLCFEQRKIVIPQNDRLIFQLKNIKKRYIKVVDDKTVKAKLEIYHPPNTHDDLAFALALAVDLMKKETQNLFIPI
jgi:hypothetical protein